MSRSPVPRSDSLRLGLNTTARHFGGAPYPWPATSTPGGAPRFRYSRPQVGVYGATPLGVRVQKHRSQPW